jgi:hypothetical protein
MFSNEFLQEQYQEEIQFQGKQYEEQQMFENTQSNNSKCLFSPTWTNRETFKNLNN